MLIDFPPGHDVVAVLMRVIADHRFQLHRLQQSVDRRSRAARAFVSAIDGATNLEDVKKFTRAFSDEFS